MAHWCQARFFRLILILLLAMGGIDQVEAANTAPTLDTVAPLSLPDGTNPALEDNDIVISYAALKGAANEDDVDSGQTINFRVMTFTGTLKHRPTASNGGGALQPVGSGYDFTSSEELVWHQAVANANGNIMAFTIKANDGAALSLTAVPVNIQVALVNDAPTFTTFTSPLIGLGSEDSEIIISHAVLLGGGNEADIDSGTINFQVIAVSSGSLGIRASSGGVTTPVGADEVVDAAHELVWNPVLNANGDLQAFTIKAIDDQGLASTTAALPVKVRVAAVNDPPDLGSVAILTGTGGTALGTEDNDIIISYATLKAAANETDPDTGDTINFQIAALTSGLLGFRASGSVAPAIPVVPGVTVLDSTKELVWHPNLNANGDLDAFTVTAIDLALATSSTARQVTVRVANDNDPPTLTTVTTLTGTGGIALGNEDTDIVISYAGLKAAADESDLDINDTINFQIVAVSTGMLGIRNAGTSDSPSAATGQTLVNSKELVWRPALDANGALPAFTIKAIDSANGVSNNAVQATVLVAALNDAPTLTTVATLTGPASVPLGIEDSDIIVSFPVLQAAANETDVDAGDAVDFQIIAVSSGTLAIRAAGSGAAGTAAVNQRFSSASELVWHPASNASGVLPAFTIKAIDAASVQSSNAIQVSISVAAGNDPPTLTTITQLTGVSEDVEFIIRRSDVVGHADEADVDGDVIDFVIVGGVTGTLGVRAINTVVAATPVIGGTTVLTDANELVWLPVANANGALTICTLVARAVDGDSPTPVALTAQVGAVNDPVTFMTGTTPIGLIEISYSLSISGYAQILPNSVGVVDPDGEPSLVSSGNHLRITARVSDQIPGEDSMVVRNTNECVLQQDGSNYRILRRGTSTQFADATFSNGLLTITTNDAAETLATDGATAPGRAAVVAWLLKTIAYTNLAGSFADDAVATRQVEIQVIEGWPNVAGGQTPAVVNAVITHQRFNEPPDGVVFANLAVSPIGSGTIELSTVTGAVPICDLLTANDDLQYVVIGNPRNGRVVDLSTPTHVDITSFLGSRLNSTIPARASGIGYENTNPAATTDRISFKVTDAGGLSFIADINISIAFDTGEARFISDPLLSIIGPAAVSHPLQLSGPTESAVSFVVSALPGFPDPGTAVVTPIAGNSSAQGDVSTNLTITPPAQSDYLAFLLTCTIGNSTTKQPYIIRLLPTVAPLTGTN
jgi:hypothetical protein